MEPISKAAAISPWEPDLFSLGVYGLLVLALVILLLFFSSRLGEKRKGPEKLRPFESGIIPTGSARLSYPVLFYLMATFFLIFDVEGAIIFTWAIAFEELGWSGWLQIIFFIIVLLIGLFYIWKKGGLDWGPTSRERPCKKTSS
ncbi:MAG: NADH-quinone oxidoreductase subunit A [Thermodesulfobacteriota bacterium]